MSTVELKKRAWYYLFPPRDYEVHCNKGGSINTTHEVTWSEYAGKIWCFYCREDMEGFGGIFDGPIPVKATRMIMGKFCFHRYNLVRKLIEAPVIRNGKMYYRADRLLTKKLRLPKGGIKQR